MAFDVVPDRFAPVEVDEVGQIILKARDLLSDPKKWHKGRCISPDGNAFCIVGAINEVVRAEDGRWRDRDAAFDRLDKLAPPSTRGFDRLYRPVAEFNDAPSTTHADVLALLDRAASQPMKGDGK